jgi:cystathionine beta-synthase
VRDAVALLHEHRVSQLPVVSAHDPESVVGSVGERGLLRHAVSDAALLVALAWGSARARCLVL